MFGHRELTLDDYLAMLRRRLLIVLIPTVLAPIVTYVATLKLPSLYTSRAKVLVEQPEVPPDYVRSVVTQRLDQRLATMKEQALSRSRLQPIIEHAGLYKDLRSKAPEELVAKMRSDTAVDLLTTEYNGRTEISGFTVSFTASAPRLAQQVCAELTSLFLEENLHERERTAQATNEFLDRQVQEAKRKLDEQDSVLAQFKSRYLGQLPGQEETNMNLLMSLSNQLEAVTEGIYRTQQDKTYAEGLLAQQVAAYEATQKGGSNPMALEQQLAMKQDQLVMLEASYTADHPDVIKMKNDIAQLKKKLQESREANKGQPPEKKDKNPALDPPSLQQLRYQIHQYQETISDRTREQQRLQRQIQVYQARVNLSPGVEEQYKKLTRDYQTALQSYNDLLGKKTQSAIATDLERRQQGEQFRLIDPANLPMKPSYPDRMKFALGGLGGGIGLGFGIALLLEMSDKSLRSDKDVEFYLEMPVLGVLPQLGGQGNPNGHEKTRFWWWSKKPAPAGKQAVGA